MSGRLSKIAARVTAAERAHYREGELGPGVPERKISSLPKIQAPQLWEFSAHPHKAERAGPHIDIRLGNPETGIAHSFVLPKRSELPGPGESARVVPTYDHTIPYMDYTGRISTEYGKGKVLQGRRTQTEVIHADPKKTPGTKLRFNLYDGANPEEFAVRRDDEGNWYITNKTLTRARRPDLPAEKPKYKEVDVKDVDPEQASQVMMPKLDGAHTLIDLQAGRSPRVFSYRTAKKAPTGLIEHTHKLTDLLKDVVPDSLDGTILRGETMAVDRKGRALPAEVTGGLLNTKVLDSRSRQAELGARLHAFPFDVVKYKGRLMQDAPFSEKLKVLKEVEKKIGDLWLPEIATTSVEKAKLIAKIEKGKHPLTREGVVLVEPEAAGHTKAKFAPDFDVFVRKVNPAMSGKTGKPHDRAGSVSYSWTEDGPIVGQVGGFSHGMARDMLKNPDKYVGRVAKVKATKVFGTEQRGALFQPRFKEWHLEKGDIEKSAFLDELAKIAEQKKEAIDPVTAATAAATGKILLSNFLTRHGAKLPPIRKLVQEVMGVGYRTAQQGKPMLSRPMRELLALGTDANLMNAYELAHGAGSTKSGLGKLLTPEMVRKAPEYLTQFGMVPKPYVKLLSDIPTESKGLRKMVDYGFTPVGQVGSDIAGATGRAAKAVTAPIQRAGSKLMSKLRGTPEI